MKCDFGKEKSMIFKIGNNLLGEIREREMSLKIKSSNACFSLLTTNYL